VLLVGGGDTAHCYPGWCPHQPATRIHLNLGQILIFLLKSNTVNEEIKRFFILIWQRLHKKKLPNTIVFSDSMITLANNER
jgi:hypothetical protein